MGPIQCIDAETMAKNPPALQGSTTAINYKYLEIEIKACQNSTQVTCASPEDIDRKMSLGYYSYYLSDNLIQLDSKSSTFEEVIKQHFTLFSIS